MPQTFPVPTAEEHRLSSQPTPLFTGAPASTAGWPPAVLERILLINERAADLHRLRVPLEDRQETNTAKMQAEQRLAQLLGHPSQNGFGLHPEDKRVTAQRALVDQLTAQVDRNNARTEQANALWQPAARVRQSINDWSRSRPHGTAVEDWPTPLPKLNGKETLLDAIARYRRRGRELLADAHRVRSAPFPSSWAKEQVRAQVAELIQRGTPDVSVLVEHGRGGATWQMETVRSQVMNAEAGAAAAFTSVPDAVAVAAWAVGAETMLQRLDAMIDAESDDGAALSHEERERREAEVLADLLEIERIESSAVWAAMAEGLPTEHRGDCNPQATLQCRLITLPVGDGSPGSSPEHMSFDLSGGRGGRRR